MAFPCTNYDDFTSGQCTWQLMEQYYYRQCFDAQARVAHNLTACPIRLGLDSELDYRHQLATLSLHPDQPTPGLVYFLQTANRPPFCHYHYDLTLVLRASLLRYLRNLRTRQIASDNSVLLNGRLDVNLIGSRGRTVTEVVFKHGEAGEVVGSNDRSSEATLPLKEYHLMLSDADLGTIHRIELHWRPAASIQPMMKPLMPKQTRALRRWLPQLSSLEGSLPSMLSELQRTLNVSTSQLQAQTSHLLGWPTQQLNDIIHPKSGSESSGTLPFVESSPTPNLSETPPLLEAVILTRLETGERQVFCANEVALKTIFQSKSLVRSGLLITSSIANPKIAVELGDQTPQLSTESLMLQLCIRDIL